MLTTRKIRRELENKATQRELPTEYSHTLSGWEKRLELDLRLMKETKRTVSTADAKKKQSLTLSQIGFVCESQKKYRDEWTYQQRGEVTFFGMEGQKEKRRHTLRALAHGRMSKNEKTTGR